MERVAGNPIHAYRLMKRLYFDWQTVEKEIKTDNWRSIVINLYVCAMDQTIRVFNRRVETVGTRTYGCQIPERRGLFRCSPSVGSFTRYLRAKYDSIS